MADDHDDQVPTWVSHGARPVPDRDDLDVAPVDGDPPPEWWEHPDPAAAIVGSCSLLLLLAVVRGDAMAAGAALVALGFAIANLRNAYHRQDQTR